MTLSIDLRCLPSFPKGKTTLSQANDEHSSIMVPQVLSWEFPIKRFGFSTTNYT